MFLIFQKSDKFLNSVSPILNLLLYKKPFPQPKSNSEFALFISIISLILTIHLVREYPRKVLSPGRFLIPLLWKILYFSISLYVA